MAETKTKQITISKITKPKVSGILLRKRLFRLLDKSGEKPVIWVSGPAGSGKTTLIASYLAARKLSYIWYQLDEGDADIASFFYYMGLAVKKAAPRYQKPFPLLTPEYQFGITTFSRRYFEELYSRVNPLIPPLAKGGKEGFVLVLDNYQDVPADSLFHEIMREGLSIVPDGVQVIVISRSEPPPALVGLRAQNKMSFIGWDEIKFTLEETDAFVRNREKETSAADAIKRLHEKTTGWAAGLVLLMEKLKTDSDISQLDTHNPEDIFNYFAGEIFDMLDDETRDFLLMSCFLPRMTVHAAEKLTGHDDAGRILSRLNRNNFFTERHAGAVPVYRYHPLFRQFLSARTRESLSRERLLDALKRAASILVESGQAEDAAEMFIESGDWPGLIGLILDQSPSLLSQGRSKTLHDWIVKTPTEILENTPWLLYWLGVCRMPYDLHESRGHFERAYGLFKILKDAAGLYLSWSSVVETYILERSVFTPIDYWISEIERLLREHPEFPSPEIKVRVTAMIFFAMMYRQPDHPDFRQWEERLLKVLSGIVDVGLRSALSSHLAFYYSWWSGELAKAEMLIKDLRHLLSRLSEVHPFAYIVFRSNEAAHFMVTGRSDLSQEAVEDALKTAEATGIRVWDFMLCLFGAHNALSDGNFEKSRRFLERAGSLGTGVRHVELSHYHFQLAWEALCLGNPNVALEHMKTAINMCIEAGTPFMEGACKTQLAEVLLESGCPEEALEVLEDARPIGRSYNSKTMEFQVLLIQTRIFLRLGKADSATESLRGHLKIGREFGIYSTPWWRPSVMVEIYLKALEEGIETDYVREVIRRRRLIPDIPHVHVEQWPWPVKIYTLGRFELVVNGEPAVFSGKVQKKPLEMLKALIALGGKDVKEETMTDLLWPESEGDAGHNAFTTTLARLRRLIGNYEVIRLYEGKVSLDMRYCWVDAFAFEGLSDKGETGKAAALYKGHFLKDEIEQPWAVPLRERLRSRFIRLIAEAGQALEQAGQCEKAAAYYQKGIEIDDISEEFYIHLMKCHLRLGRKADALNVYGRCKRMLASVLGVEPSPETEEIYRNLKTK